MEDRFRLIHYVNENQKKRLMKLMGESEKAENSLLEIEAALSALHRRYQNTLAGQDSNYITAEQKKHIADTNNSISLIFDVLDKLMVRFKKAKEISRQGMMQMAIKERKDNSSIDEELDNSQNNL